MISILKSGYAKIMQLFYKDKTAKIHLREIARQTHLHVPSALHFLYALEKEHILKSQKEGNLKKYFVLHSKKSYFIYEAFDLERLEKLPLLRRKAIQTYLDQLLEKPIFVLLFGSTAKETFRENSDIDLFLIVNRKISTTQAQKETEALTGLKISVFQMTYPHFITELKMKEDPVLQSALQSGYPLINHITYYEVSSHERI